MRSSSVTEPNSVHAPEGQASYASEAAQPRCAAPCSPRVARPREASQDHEAPTIAPCVSVLHESQQFSQSAALRDRPSTSWPPLRGPEPTRDLPPRSAPSTKGE